MDMIADVHVAGEAWDPLLLANAQQEGSCVMQLKHYNNRGYEEFEDQMTDVLGIFSCGKFHRHSFKGQA